MDILKRSVKKQSKTSELVTPIVGSPEFVPLLWQTIS